MRVRIKINDRIFIVDFDDAGEPLRIYERKRYGTPPLDGWYNSSYWNTKHHVVGGGKTIVRRIIEDARRARAARAPV